MSIENLLNKEINLNKYVKYISNRSNISEFNKILRNFKTNLEELREEGRIFKIGIVGQVKCGKSSFLNALLFDQDELLPMAATPMTAALTVIEYSDKNSAKIEFYNEEDWKEINKLNNEYKKEFEERAKLEKEECEKKNKVYDPKKVISKIDATLRSANEIVEHFKNNGLKESECIGESKDIDLKDKKSFAKDLEKFVGANGKYTPIVKKSTLYINDEKLKGYRIVDSPGTNDPIVSRGETTKRLLGSCDYIIFLSYSTQFLDKNDKEYVEIKLPSQDAKENKILIVGTKFDGQLLQESVVDEAEGDIKTAYDIETKKLRRKFDIWVEDFKQNKKDLGFEKSTLEFQSTYLYKMARNFENLSEGQKQYLDRLKKDYESSDLNAELLLELSGMKKIEEKRNEILARKEQIMKESEKALLNDRSKKLKNILFNIEKDVKRRKIEVENGDIKEKEEEAKKLQSQISNLQRSIEEVVEKQKDEISSSLSKELEQINSQKGRYGEIITQTRTYLDEEDEEVGWFSGWKFWPHTETRTVRRSQTYANIQDSIEKISNFSDKVDDKIGRISERIFSKSKIKREIKNAVVDLFEVRDRKMITDVVENYIENLNIPIISFDKEKYTKVITSKYSNTYGETTDAQSLINLHNQAFTDIMNDVEDLFSNVRRDMDTLLLNVENNIVDALKEGLEKEVESLRELIANGKESIKILEDATRDIKEIAALIGE